ncbi:MAG: DUF4872 domain-containing protein [Patulibacter sp.]
MSRSSYPRASRRVSRRGAVAGGGRRGDRAVERRLRRRRGRDRRGSGVLHAVAGARRGDVPARRAPRWRPAGVRHRQLLLVVDTPQTPIAQAVRGGLAMTAVGGARAKRRERGPAGVAAFAGRVGDRGRKGWLRRFGGDGELAAALIALADVIEHEDRLRRGAQAAYERRAAELLGIASLADVAEHHDALAVSWREVAGQAREAAAAGDPAAQLPALAARIEALAGAEGDALELLRTTLRAH